MSRRCTVLALIAAILAVVLPTSGCGTARPAAPAGPAASAGVSPDFNAADVTFVRTLIPHHRQGIAIARAAADRSGRSDVRILTGAIAATQQDEVTRLTGWLQAWAQPPVSASAAAGGTEAAALRKVTGPALDRQVLTRLVAHQQEAVRIAETESRTGRNPNALAYARQIQQSRPAEIDQMRAMLQSH